MKYTCVLLMVEIPINRVTPPFRTGKLNLLFHISHLLDFACGWVVSHFLTTCAILQNELQLPAVQGVSGINGQDHLLMWQSRGNCTSLDIDSRV